MSAVRKEGHVAMGLVIVFIDMNIAISGNTCIYNVGHTCHSPYKKNGSPIERQVELAANFSKCLVLWQKNMFTSAATCVILLVALVTSGHSLICDDPDDVNTGKCAQLSKELEKALVQDAGNLYRLRKVFFHSATATPVLLKVLYNVTFMDNFITAVDVEDIPNCSSSTLNNSTIELEQTNITLGWTLSGVYAVFHPTVLSVMQVQSPFAIMRLFHFTLDQRSPEADSFLWDGSYDLPTVQLNLHNTSLTCVPSYDLLVSLLGKLNQLVRSLSVIYVYDIVIPYRTFQ